MCDMLLPRGIAAWPLSCAASPWGVIVANPILDHVLIWIAAGINARQLSLACVADHDLPTVETLSVVVHPWFQT